jgi:tetratricopeptide (TPR) repeat protein
LTNPTTLAGVEQAAQEALRALHQGSTMVTLTGPAGAGKSAALRMLAGSKPQSPFKRMVLVAPPESEHNPDAGLVGLVELAAQLDPDQLLETVKRLDITWKGKLDEVQKVLKRKASSTLLLFDGPFLPQREEYISTIFADRSAELTRTLLGVPGLRKVVATDRGALPAATEVTVSPRCNPSEVLAGADWDSLAEFARDLLKAGGDALAELSPLELRLRVGLVAVGEDAARQSRHKHAPHKLVRLLLERVGPGAQALKKILGRLSVFRTSIDEYGLSDVGLAELEPLSQALVKRVLLFGPQDQLRIHEAIAREAIQGEWLTPSESREAHRLAAQYHQARFEKATQRHHVRIAVRHELEVIHHLTQAGDARRLLERSVFFVEQYDALGRALSQQRHHDEAIPAYERALAHNPSDAYAHHYLAYNLDVLAKDPQRVEREFREAILHRRDHVWYRGRFINFLLVRGRIREAHEEWERALAELLPSGPSTDARLYRELHGETARLLLHRGQLEFAAEVLEDVPRAMLAELSWYRALRRLYERLRAAALDEEVFPPHLAEEKRWQGPHLLHLESDKQRIEEWMPGRISAADEEGVHIRVARASPGGAVEFLWCDLDIEEYRQLARDLREREGLLPAGTFVEVIKLRGEEEFLKSYPATPFEDRDLPALYPPPDRYLRRVPATT